MVLKNSSLLQNVQKDLMLLHLFLKCIDVSVQIQIQITRVPTRPVTPNVRAAVTTRERVLAMQVTNLTMMAKHAAVRIYIPFICIEYIVKVRPTGI